MMPQHQNTGVFKLGIIGTGLGAALVLLLLNFVLNNRIQTLNRDSIKNTGMLKEAVPDFNEQTMNKYEQDIMLLKKNLFGLANAFDPRYLWMKKSYDSSIYFVEELGNINKTLSAKAKEKRLSPPEIGFKDKLPAEKEAVYLLNQLHGLKQIITLGLDYGVNFKSIKPLDSEELKGVAGIKKVNSRLELACPSQSLIEFIIRINESVPLVSFDSVSLTSDGANFNIDLVLSHFVMEKELQDILEPLEMNPEERDFAVQNAVEFSSIERGYVSMVRGNNPFFVASRLKDEQEELPQSISEPIQVRFIYRGKAVLKGKEVVVVEDTVNKETSFVGIGDRLGKFIVSSFSDDTLTLKKNGTSENLLIKREAK